MNVHQNSRITTFNGVVLTSKTMHHAFVFLLCICSLLPLLPIHLFIFIYTFTYSSTLRCFNYFVFLYLLFIVILLSHLHIPIFIFASTFTYSFTLYVHIHIHIHLHIVTFHDFHDRFFRCVVTTIFINSFHFNTDVKSISECSWFFIDISVFILVQDHLRL